MEVGDTTCGSEMSISLLEASQSSHARPSDKGRMRMKTLRWYWFADEGLSIKAKGSIFSLLPLEGVYRVGAKQEEIVARTV